MGFGRFDGRAVRARPRAPHHRRQNYSLRGASGLASRIGLSPLVIGLTVVAYGTSAPELAISASAALSGEADLAVGNVIGSNIFNILFVLGLSATIAPLLVSQQLVRIDVPIMIAASSLLLLFAWDGNLNRTEGVLLFSGRCSIPASLSGKAAASGRKSARSMTKPSGLIATAPGECRHCRSSSHRSSSVSCSWFWVRAGS
ncbi:MAG: hypothetical protein R2849_14690 [Thermomicrobiales bacterium]